MPPVSALIADDERLARDRIRRLLALDPDIEVLGECDTGPDAVEAMRKFSPHLLFLDIQMPGLDGFGVLEAVDREQFPVVVFVTAYDAYALKAFEVRAFDYLLKPFDRKRFYEVLKRAKQQVELIRGGETNSRLLELLETLDPQRLNPGRIAIRSGGHVTLIKTEAIDWIEAADNYVCLHCGSETHIVRETMNSFERRLDPHRFLRIHRSTIVNLDQVKEMQPWFRGDYQVILRSGTKLTLSRSYRDKLRGILLKSSL
jgi:two-component system LytT family response regulator